MEYILYCDESIKRGDRFSYFYGGALVKSIHLEEVNERLGFFKIQKDINTEMKWTRVSASFLEIYKAFIDIFFDLIFESKIKMRVMFQQNEFSDKIITKLPSEKLDDSYFKLYYQFIKLAFGLIHAGIGEKVYIRAFFDQFPDKIEKVRSFKDYIYKLQFSDEFKRAMLAIRYEDIVEADSKEHLILQCVDIITGAMNFKLNRLNLIKDESTNRRGNRTIAKEKLYKHIYSRISEWKPGFNAGVSTGIDNDFSNNWLYPYSHWRFMPKQ
ncbi:DUF3800 domain-containing protein [Salicibibacter cibi]|uniref:DUF3800 domain-containing protein n=1 Tax=Salicibibacter cibi TaxID=2743001 RepID=A0A7T6ZEM8_9BACI|nr:DUF3800 domain-containing protein [Salicibibacter cibi]QQK81701.1 DUF3800 domain-containing protein [Salicibibacter cibi]